MLFDSTYVNANKYLDDYLRLKDLLTQKYGQPQEDDSRWSNTLFQDDVSEWGTAIAAGYLSLWSSWDLGSTSVELSCTGESFKVTLKIIYQSTRLAAAHEDKKRQELLDDL